MSEHRLKRDEIPWVHVAIQVLNGEWNGADKSTLKSIKIGLFHIDHPKCKEAVELLKKLE